MGADARSLAGIWEGALALVYPPQCVACGTAVAEQGSLCPDCWREAAFIHGAACACCGLPLASEGDGGSRQALDALACDGCLGVVRPWTRGVAALGYAGTGRKLVLALKHGDRPDLARPLGDWLAQAAHGLAVAGMVVVPVPVHPARLLRRRYNQAALIAARVARRLDLPHRPAALRRVRNTPMQDHRSITDRFANQQGAMAVPAAARAAIAGRPVLLIDDVMASGATLGAAAEALAEAGAAEIRVGVVARALRDT